MGEISEETGRMIYPSIFIASPPEAGAEATVFKGYGALTFTAEPPRGVPAFYAPDFHLVSKAPWVVPERFEVGSLQSGAKRFVVTPPPHSPLDRRTIETEVAHLIARIDHHEFQKLVPVWFERSGFVPSSSEYESLVANAASLSAPTHFPYGFLAEYEGMVGVSPEILFRVDSDGTIHTMALAGTQRIDGGGGPDDLLADRKERGEHTLVVEFIRDALGDSGTVEVGETTVRELPGLRHLYTPITVRPRVPLEFGDLVTLLHPTPALGAAPRKAGLEWLKSRESTVPRGRHGAPFGVVLPDGSMVCLVAIRNLQWDRSGSMIGAGCGIVSGSTPEREYREATAKIAAVKSMLGISS